MFVLTNGWAVDHPRRQQGERVTYVRDALDRITSISESTAAYAAYKYDDRDRRTRATPV